MEVLLVLIFLVPFVISLLSSLSVTINGSDQAYHLLMIKAIVKNNHKFVTTIPFFVGKNRHAYPQLIHWFFSFFSEKRILRLCRFTGTFGHLLSGVALYFFAKLLFPFMVESGYEIPNVSYMIVVALTYALSPINYDLFNAKNIGFSARGFGLFLGQVFTYISIFYVLDILDLSTYLILAGIVVYLILISSVFAIQYVVFYSLIASIVFTNIFLMLPLFVGAGVYFLFKRKIAIEFAKGQLAHKKTYALHLAKVFILKNRYSIWRDFVYDFWLKLFNIFRRKESMFGLIKYFMTNNLVNLLIGIPFLFLIFFTFPISDSGLNGVLAYHIFIGLLMFLLTSFRWTRFLGEPDRYVEFVLGVLAIYLAIKTYPNYKLQYILAAVCHVVIVLRVIMVNRMLKKVANSVSKDIETGSIGRTMLLDPVKELLVNLSENRSDLKVISNLSENSKMIMSDRYQLFRYTFFNERIKGYHFTDIYRDSFFMIDFDILKKLMKDFNINVLVYGRNNKEEDVWNSNRLNSLGKVVFADDYNKVILLDQ